MTHALLNRRTLSLLLAAGCVAGPALAQPERFPSRPIKVLIGFTAGGSTDVPFRVLAENASKILGQPVIIENKPGAGGVLPAQMMQSTPADGYTLAQVPLPVFRLPYTQKINWNPATDPRVAEAPCYACLYPEDAQDDDLRCATTGILAPLTGLIGCLQAIEAIKLITGFGHPATGMLQRYDALSGTWHQSHVRQDPTCPVCHKHA